MTTLYYPRIHWGRWFWSRVQSDESLITPYQSCEERVCHGHETAYGAVQHHAEWICEHSKVLSSNAFDEMQRCAICKDWTDRRVSLSLCPFDDRLFVCGLHSEDNTRGVLQTSHFRWRGVEQKTTRTRAIITEQAYG